MWMWENWCLLQWLYLNVTLWCQTSLKSTPTCHCTASLTFGATFKLEIFRLECFVLKHVGHPYSRPVFYCTGINTASVSLWCANIKAASEPLVTEKKVYLKIKLYPSLSQTEMLTWCPVFHFSTVWIICCWVTALKTDRHRTSKTTETFSAEVYRDRYD